MKEYIVTVNHKMVIMQLNTSESATPPVDTMGSNPLQMVEVTKLLVDKQPIASAGRNTACVSLCQLHTSCTTS